MREVIEAARRITGHAIPVVEHPRRAGDLPVLCADASKITRELDWKPKHTDLQSIVASAWAWHKSHPRGFDDRPRGA